jgi:hypothetical protein
MGMYVRGTLQRRSLCIWTEFNRFQPAKDESANHNAAFWIVDANAWLLVAKKFHSL